jgi:hypothetical protein
LFHKKQGLGYNKLDIIGWVGSSLVYYHKNYVKSVIRLRL